MTETKNVTLALGVICIVLAASLVVVVADGLFFSDQPNTKDLEAQVSSLNTQITSLQNQVNNLNSKVSDYEEQIADLTDEKNNYASIIALDEFMVILENQMYTQDANDVTSIFNETLDYAGYVEIQVESTSNTTYVQVSYTYEGLNFNQISTVSTDGTAYFPVLPGTIEILFGNTGTETNDATVTLTYIY
ncbi:MAG: hypothetical protein FWG55_00800 [Candidatus Bathyarchaeota archaeon]|nr:hypothetical protein [Candidatus Termiticorpusculum sp.]